MGQSRRPAMSLAVQSYPTVSRAPALTGRRIEPTIAHLAAAAWYLTA
jgi:hypothetical protein